LIVAGQFNMIGGTPANNIAAWDGNSWTALGSGVNGIVRALSVHNGILYAGGQFTTAGSINNANHIAAWNGSSWTGLDGGVSAPGGAYVTALLSTANGLVAGGIFQQAGMTSPLATRNIALWNGISWSQNFNSSPNLFDGPIYTLREYQGQLYAAGTFTTPFLNTARWNGSNWNPNGGGINLFNQINYNGVEAQYVYNGDLIVGGHFRNADNLPATQHIASWNGSTWQAMAGSNMPDTTDAIHDFIQFNNKLYAGGAINQMGSQLLNGVGEWDGSAWSSTGHPKQLIHALANYDSCGAISCNLYSGGEGSFNRWICLTSTEDAREKMEFILRPNPARDRLQLVFGNAKPGPDAAIRLFNVDGKVHHVEVVNTGESMELDVSGLPPGLYVLEYRDGRHQPVVRRFSKM
ncbi:MAG TPA: T9SS type A sorting domain-containing protein, partial [Saprospiraceae bacterium]|nr:T9SS type A sorting domain-containing protein [Saprospiraceae bacterium]